jgi:RNA polymerase sigma-70 factor (ECF subfamily)
MSKQYSISESAAFDRLYREQGSPVRRFLQVWLRNSSAADDLTQETFLHFWRRRSAFDPKRGDIRYYLFGIARKKAADWHRRKTADSARVERIAERTSPLLIQDALDQLPDDLRTILWLREVEGYSYDELAEILKIPLGTVRSRLHSARQQLRTI